MQYLLSEEEYGELVRQRDARIRASTDELQAVCTLAAQHIPVARSWAKDATPAPWGCILGPREQNPGYCDDCPVKAICPYKGKEFSK